MIGYIQVEGSNRQDAYKLTVDGKPVSREQGFAGPTIRKTFFARIYDATLYDQVVVLTFEEILDQFESVDLEYPFFWHNGFEEFYIEDIQVSRHGVDQFSLIFHFNFYTDEWKQPWSITDHMQEFRAIFDKQNLTNAELSELDIDYLSESRITFYINNTDANVDSEIKKCVSILEDILDQTFINLSLRLQGDAIVVRFDFPDQVKIPCQQYLLYFVQFLQDIGIEASAKLKEEAGKVLFSVTPKSKEEALENIKMALEIFLRLPMSQTINTSYSPNTDIEVQRLVANIYHLKGQLALETAVVQQKDMLIQQQQTFIQQLLSGEVLVQSIEVSSQNENDKEPIMGDIVSIKKFDWQFIELDLPTLLRRLKQLFGRRELE